MRQLAEHLKESAVLHLQQPKKLISVIGTTSDSGSPLVEQASTTPIAGLCAGTMHCTNAHSLGTGTSTAALQVWFWWILPSSLHVQRGWKTVVEVLNCFMSLLFPLD